MTSPPLLIQRLLNLGIVREEELQPCSQADIRRLEWTHRVVLPESYKVFLQSMGRGAGDFLCNDHWYAYYESLLTLNQEVREHLQEIPLPETWFCFATRMGEVYLFFNADGLDDDPPIYYWNERIDPKVEKGYTSFWEWFEEMVAYYEAYGTA